MTIQTYKITLRTVNLTNKKPVIAIKLPDMLTCTMVMPTNFNEVMAAIVSSTTTAEIVKVTNFDVQ